MSSFSNSEKEITYEKIPWQWILPAVVLISFSGVMTQYFLRTGESIDIGRMGYLHEFNSLPLIAFLFILLLSRFRVITTKVKTSTLAYIYSVTSISMLGTSCLGLFRSFLWIFGAKYVDSYKLANYMPFFWAPSKETLATFLKGGSISLEWVPVIIFWSTFQIALWFCIVGFSIFFRYQWIDVENLTYPYAAVSVDCIDYINEPKGSKTRLFLIGTLMGFVFFLPVIIRMNFVWFPDLYGWFNPVTHNTGYWGSLRPQNVMPSVYQSAVGLTQITYNPLYIALAMFIPVNTLFSASFFYIVYILVGTQIAYLMGYYTGINTASDGARTTMLRNQPPINVTVFSEHGILIATLVMAVLLNFKNSIIRPLRIALGKEPSDLEKKEPTSYRIALTIILISSILIIGMLAISGFTIDDAIIFLGMALLMQLAFARIRGFSGAIPVGAYVGPVFYRWKYPNVTMANVPRSFFLFGTLHYHVTSLTVAFENSPSIFENWRVSAALGVNNRNLFKIMCVTVVISSFVALTTFVSFGSLVGHSNTPRGGYWTLYDGGATAIPSYIYTTPARPVWPWIAAGALLTIALSFMHQRFVWWPLDPVGAFLATGGPGVKIGLGWVFIIAFVIKYLTMKLGGTKAYTDTVMPLSTGFIAGSVLSTVLGAIIGIITFIRPI